jgi:protein ImuB
MRRVACIALPCIRIEIARASVARGPLAVVVARPGGAVQCERDVLGNTKLDFVSEEARALGMRAGQTVAAARAKSAELSVRVVAQEAVRAALVRVAESVLVFGLSVAFDVATDVVWVDVTGTSHLHGGESKLAQTLADRARRLGHACRVALAEGPRIAAAVARFLPERFWKRKQPAVVPQGQGSAAMGALPVAALGLDEETARWLADLGLRTCASLQKLPRAALGARLGARVHDVYKLLDGEDPTPLDAWRPAQVPEERIELEWGIGSVEALAFVLKTLCDRLAARLEGRAVVATRLAIEFALDRALCEGVARESTIEVALPAPVVKSAELMSILRARLERHALSAPVLAVTLRATGLASASARTVDLLSPEPKAQRTLPRLVAELAADFGEASVGTLALVNTWAPDERTRLLPFGVARVEPRYSLVTSSLEPSRLVPAARVPRECLADAVLLARIEGCEWWRRGVERRDVFAVFLPVGGGDKGGGGDKNLAWVEQRGPGAQPRLRGWID